jgi:hypothetical protein
VEGNGVIMQYVHKSTMFVFVLSAVSELWTYRLGEETIAKYRRAVERRIEALPDLAAIMEFNVTRTRDEMFETGRVAFRSEIEGEFLAQFSRENWESAIEDFRETIERDLRRFRAELSHILTKQNKSFEICEEEAIKAIQGLRDDQVADFNLIRFGHNRSDTMVKRFLEEVHENQDAESDFSGRIHSCLPAIRRSAKEHLYLQHAQRMKQVFRARVREVAQEMFSVGTVLAIVGNSKPAWMGASWEPVEEGRILASSAFTASEMRGHYAHDVQSGAPTIQKSLNDLQDETSEPQELGTRQTWTTASDTEVSGNAGHEKGNVSSASNDHPYLRATFWRRMA